MSLSDYLALFPPSSLAMTKFSALAGAVLQQSADLQALEQRGRPFLFRLTPYVITQQRIELVEL